MEHCLTTFLVIGGGASGVLTAVQLLSHTSTGRVILFERGARIGAGIAYGTDRPGHLLNVPAIGMSAFPDQPDHFLNWLSHERRWMPHDGWTAQSFAPRRLYRDYIASLLDPYRKAEPHRRLEIVQGEVVDLEENSGGVTVFLRDGGSYTGDTAVLATGNEGPAVSKAPWRHDFWSSRSGFDIPADATVAIIGTGLSMVDSVVTLLEAGHRGQITAISRRGLLPRAHGATATDTIAPEDIPFAARPSHLLMWLRRRIRARNDDWRATIDGLRPHTQRLWQSLSPADKRRFLRHSRPWWDVHRHRMAPQIRAIIDNAMTSGQLTVVSGRLHSVEEAGDTVCLRYTPRGETGEREIIAQRVIECRGGNADVGATRNPLLGNLLRRGTIRPDAERLGIDVTTSCAVVDLQGRPSGRVYAVGPLTAGTFWEIIAVPDIRRQAKNLAGHLAGQFA